MPTRRSVGYGVPPVSNEMPIAAAADRFPRSHFGYNGRVGDVVIGNKALWVTINDTVPSLFPVVFPASLPSRTVVRGAVKVRAMPTGIRSAFIVARNLFSPQAHQTRTSPMPLRHFTDTPQSGQMRQFGAQPPRLWKMPQKIGQRPSGRYSIPAPQVTPFYPTSAEWLLRKLGRA